MPVMFGSRVSLSGRLAAPALLAALVCLASVPPAWADHLGLAWESPLRNADGTPLRDLAGYRVYYGRASSAAVSPPCNGSHIDVGALPTYHLPGLTRGVRYYFRITARDSGGQESECSNQITAVPGPAVPVHRGQRQADRMTPIALGGKAASGTVAFQATVRDSDAAQPIRLQVEVKRLGTAFTGAVSCESGFTTSGRLARCAVSGLVGGAGYHWRARTADSQGLMSAWVSFAINPEAVADFTVNRLPAVPTSRGQRREDGITPLPLRGTATSGTVVFLGTVSDPDAAQTVRLQVEVKPVGTAFTGAVSCQSGLVASGTATRCTVSGLVRGTGYHWRARSMDSQGRAGAWSSFATNQERAPDFSIAGP
jgi:hypothetical protein